ncbi:MAG: two-component system phosphate regulon sensor histidine kinase PhoR [Candidatus Omnitrophota bacterium]
MRISIRNKTLTLFLTIVVILLASICYYLNFTLSQFLFHNIQDKLIKEANLATIYVQNNISSVGSVSKLDTLADTIGEQLDLRVTIINAQGVVLGDSELSVEQVKGIENHLTRPEISTAFRQGVGESRRYSVTVKQEMLYYARSFSHDNTTSVLRLAIPLFDIQVLSKRLLQTLVFGLIIALFVTAIIGFFATKYMTQPLLAIANVAKGIANGNFSNRTGIYSQDEIGDLAKSIDHMSDQIRMRIDEVSQSRTRLEAVFFNMFDGVMIVDNDGKIKLINDTLKELIDLKEEAIDKRPLEVIRTIEIQNIIDDILIKGEAVVKSELRLLLPEERVLLVHATPIKRNDQFDGAVLVFHDVTEIQRLESIRRDFVANVSHELRTPVTSIKGYTETLLDGAIEDKEVATDFLNIIQVDCDRLVKLVDELLDLSKIESGKYDLNKNCVNLSGLIEKVIKHLKKQAAKNNIEMINDSDKNLSKVLCDEVVIEQVFFNLCENAIKYNKENGSIKISAEESESSVTFHIQDTGIGIPDKDLSRIYERFYRVDKARSREFGGTGLGLSIVKHLIQAHGGDVYVTSQVGVGTTFSFSLPKA